MSRAIITITIAIEYEQVPEYYQKEDQTPEKMLAVDLQAAEDDPYLFLEREGTWSFSGEVKP